MQLEAVPKCYNKRFLAFQVTVDRLPYRTPSFETSPLLRATNPPANPVSE